MFRALNFSRDEKGQSLVEVSVGIVILALIIIIVFEAGLVFSTYISLLNASREGAVYASKYPDVDRSTLEQVVRDEGAVAGLIRENIGLDYPPTIDSSSERCKRIHCVTVKVHYALETFTSTISLPFFGRFGLPAAWIISAETTMPLRGGE